jgi:hypothetical protein
MQKGHTLEFTCLSCSQPVPFSIFLQDENPLKLCCGHCQKKYLIEDPVLLRQMKKFSDLCKQLIVSEEILSNTNVGISIGGHDVKIPYKLLLTRFHSHLDLTIGNQPFKITFRVEPLVDAACILN